MLTMLDNADLQCYYCTSEMTEYCQEKEFFNLLLGLLIRSDFETSFWHLEFIHYY